ncbi:MAG: hypothetical protein LBQ81_03955 [Zoogloeaceae bacterium]|nr:hypothetical protein [Zoogloeaceae bacterium]
MNLLFYAGNSFALDLKKERGNSENGCTSGSPVQGEITCFIPEGFSVLHVATGDFNLDAYPDKILVLKRNDEEESGNYDGDYEAAYPRPLLILAGQADKTYKLVARNDKTVYCYRCGGMLGDPFTGVTIEKGFFSIEFYGGSGGGRWTRIVTYRYSKPDNAWFLHRDGVEGFDPWTGKTTHETMYTVKDFGKLPFEKFDIYRRHSGSE